MAEHSKAADDAYDDGDAAVEVMIDCCYYSWDELLYFACDVAAAAAVGCDKVEVVFFEGDPESVPTRDFLILNSFLKNTNLNGVSWTSWIRAGRR